MWRIVFVLFIQFFIFNCIIKINPYDTKTKKRIRRFIKAILWILSGFVSVFLISNQLYLYVFLGMCAVFAMKYLWDMINPYLGDAFFGMVFYGIISFLIISYTYRNHPNIAWIVFLVFVMFTILYWVDGIKNMRKYDDADIQKEKELEEKSAKSKRRKTIFKLARLAVKAWRL